MMVPDTSHIAHAEALEGHDVHVWLGPLDSLPEAGRQLNRLLSGDERQRAERMRREEDRRRFVVARGLLRCLLASYTGTAPEHLDFSYGPTGQPRLRRGGGLSFNLSHSRHLLLVAIARGRSIGVDLEPIRPLAHMEAVGRRVFSSSERAELAGLEEDERLTAFFNGWTRKEAFAKAVGDGLWASLGRVEVTLAPARRPRILLVDGSEEAAKAWSVFHLQPSPGFVGAVAAEGRELRLSTRAFELSDLSLGQWDLRERSGSLDLSDSREGSGPSERRP